MKQHAVSPVYLFASVIFFGLCSVLAQAQADTPLWGKFEYSFTSAKTYENPLYTVEKFLVRFTSPSGRTKTVSGFWDGGLDWKVRFMPDETGNWTFESSCSDTLNTGLHGVRGALSCAPGKSGENLYTKGALGRAKGAWHIMYANGDPFFWLGDTAWNGALRSSDEEWDRYLADRAAKGYSVIQFATTQWRGCAGDENGRIAFEGSGRIRVNPEFFRRMDHKIDRINESGLAAAPVLLFALPRGPGRELSPGYYLPEPEAIILAKYMVARWGGNHVVWVLGGDGKYIDEYEQRWKTIGRGVFGGEHPGLVAQHPMGRTWIGNIYAEESWLDIVGYQSSHGRDQQTVEWITRGPVAREWAMLPARPLMNLEPLYENIFKNISDRDVRIACWWSILATPVSGLTYGANGIWPWLRKGEKILNHIDAPHTKTWEESLSLPAGTQAGYLAAFMRKLEWRSLRPAPEMLAIQPGDSDFKQFIAVAASDNHELVVAYTPTKRAVSLFIPLHQRYSAKWFDPSAATYQAADVVGREGILEATPPGEGDWVLLLEKR